MSGKVLTHHFSAVIIHQTVKGAVNFIFLITIVINIHESDSILFSYSDSHSERVRIQLFDAGRFCRSVDDAMNRYWLKAT